MAFDRVAVEAARPVRNSVQTFAVTGDGRREILLPYDIAQSDVNDRKPLDRFLAGDVNAPIFTDSPNFS